MDSTPYTFHALTAAAEALDPHDWTAHRALAQAAAESGYTAHVTQVFDNCEGHPVAHETTIDPIPVETPATPIQETFGPMGDTTTIETFSPSVPDGYYGRRTPLEYMP